VTNTCDYLIVGAGIIGLTVARELKQRAPQAKIIILEKEPHVGQHASGRNSGVLHSGVYYGGDTLKAKICAAGAVRMREFAAEHGIACNKSGKVIIATTEHDLPTLDRLLMNARQNRVRAEKLDAAGIREIEPHASPFHAGIYCQDTTVIDSKSVLHKLRAMLEKSGVEIIFNMPVLEISTTSNSITTPQGIFSYGFLYNCAGASADLIAKKCGQAQDYTLIPFKGIYYKIRPERNYLVRSNIYPVPDMGLPFLGVHLTRVISGDVYVGPTAIPAFGRENYGFFKGMRLDETLKISTELLGLYLQNKRNFRLLVHTEIKKYLKPWFLASAQRLVAELRPDDLISCDKVGIRPQLINHKTREIQMDYVLENGKNCIHVLNAISPAFTSSFAFAEWIVDQAEGTNVH